MQITRLSSSCLRNQQQILLTGLRLVLPSSSIIINRKSFARKHRPMTPPPTEKLENVSFIEDFVSPYIKGVKFTFTQNNRRKDFDLVLRHCSVAVVLYHTELKKFVFVRQFRPAVLVGHILRQPENFGKKLSEVRWSDYEAAHGYTLELCAGLIDKNVSIVEVTKEEIEEECGYSVKNEDIHLIGKFSIAAHEAGGVQYLFYAEIDDSMKITEGGGNAYEGEYITKVFLSESEVLEYVKNDYCTGPPSMLYGLLWWFAHKPNHKLIQPTSNSYEWKPINMMPMTDFKFEKMPSSPRFNPHRMNFTLGTLTRNWDLALCDDSVSILLYNENANELLLTQRFRPAALVGRVRHLTGGSVPFEEIDWESQPIEWAYTLELCSGHYKSGSSVEEIDQRVRDIVAKKCGYSLQDIRFVTSFIIGISFAGDRQRAYYARVNDSMRIKGWNPCEDIIPV
ncbi:Nudix hydrolase domain-containing protein [Trichostrongylus colubriformis]|uniref:Uridine diphosphate glucose pyrophosphatase NUDT14 n=1 Tax=Trichostrongylus colubriformis TaxID=6319 RepID=A0AAN8ID59_TRICO